MDEQTDARIPAPVSIIERMSEAAGALAAILLALLALLMLSELAARNLLGQSLHFTWELSAYAMGGVFFLAAASALRHGNHVRVSVMLELLGRRAARRLDFAVTLAAIGIVFFLAMSLGALTLRSISGDVRSWSGFRVPLAIPQAVFFFGAVILAMQLVARAVRLFLGLPPDAATSDDLEL